MRYLKLVLPKALGIFVLFTVLCGVVYPALATGLAQLLFPRQANGSMIESGGKRYGSALLGQPFTDEGHLWGRVMKLDVSTYAGEDGRPLLYAAPSNLSPASEEFATLVAARVEKLRAANPDMGEAPVPVDLVTCSGSGLDPGISPAAAEYQVARIAKARGIPAQEVRDVISACTSGRFLGVFGEETVNVLQVNLLLDGVLK